MTNGEAGGVPSRRGSGRDYSPAGSGTWDVVVASIRRHVAAQLAKSEENNIPAPSWPISDTAVQPAARVAVCRPELITSQKGDYPFKWTTVRRAGVIHRDGHENIPACSDAGIGFFGALGSLGSGRRGAGVYAFDPLIYKSILMPRFPPADWLAEQARLTVFPMPDATTRSPEWWQQVTDTQPDETTMNPKKGSGLIQGAIDPGKLILRLERDRIDWVLAPETNRPQILNFPRSAQRWR